MRAKLRETPMGTLGSGNVFADLGLTDAETRLLKAKLASKIDDEIVRRGLSVADAGATIGVWARRRCRNCATGAPGTTAWIASMRFFGCSA